eukprot:766751-Hanusia_phi.AAC.5
MVIAAGPESAEDEAKGMKAEALRLKTEGDKALVSLTLPCASLNVEQAYCKLNILKTEVLDQPESADYERIDVRVTTCIQFSPSQQAHEVNLDLYTIKEADVAEEGRKVNRLREIAMARLNLCVCSSRSEIRLEQRAGRQARSRILGAREAHHVVLIS